MLPRQGTRRSYVSTVAIPAWVTRTDTGLVELGHRDERAGRRDLEPLRDGMWQDALALADLLYGIAERGELAGSAEPPSASSRFSRPGTDVVQSAVLAACGC